MIIISIWLYGKPSWDLPIEGKSIISPSMLQDQADYLYSHLHSIAYIIDKLLSKDWNFSEVYGEFYALVFYKNTSFNNAEREIMSLNIPSDKISMEEIS